MFKSSPVANNGTFLLVASLCIAITALAISSLFIGPAFLSAGVVIDGMTGRDPAAATIIREIRLPRTILALSVGGMLGLSGAAAQSLTRNPLAEPAVFGTSQAAAFGAVLVLYTGTAGALSPLVPLASILAAIVSVLLLLIVLKGNHNIVSLLLVGLGIGSFSGAAISMVISFSNNPYAVTEIVFWLMGSFEDRSMYHVYLSLPFLLLSGLIIFSCSKGYRALTLGSDVAASLGINVNRVALITVLGIALGVGAGVAVSGAIGFVGLIAPHLVRPFCHGEPAKVLLPALLAGAALTTTADIAVRLLPSAGELRVGVLTAFVGVPLFIYLIVTHRGFATEPPR